MIIEVSRPSSDGLSNRTFYFKALMNHKIELVLDAYLYSVRPTKRHKLAIVERYDRIDKRWNTMKADQVEVPMDVRSEVLDKFMARVAVVVTNQLPTTATT